MSDSESDSESDGKSESDPKKRSRAWCVTWNGYTEDRDVPALMAWTCSYIVATREVGKAGNAHIQGYVYFEEAKSLQTMKDKFSRSAHWLKAIGSAQQNRDYCLKGDQSKKEWRKHKTTGPNYGSNVNIICERGKLPANQQQKGASPSELIDASIDAIERKCLDEVAPHLKHRISSYEYFIAARKRARRNLVDLPGERGTHHEWHSGVPGAGKTKFFRDRYPNSYELDITDKWWDEYDDHSVVIIPDLHPKDAGRRPTLCKQLLDQVPFRAQQKNDKSHMIRPKKVIFLSNYEPDECWGGIDLEAIESRIAQGRYHWPLRYGEPGWAVPDEVLRRHPPTEADTDDAIKRGISKAESDINWDL